MDVDIQIARHVACILRIGQCGIRRRLEQGVGHLGQQHDDLAIRTGSRFVDMRGGRRHAGDGDPAADGLVRGDESQEAFVELLEPRSDHTSVPPLNRGRIARGLASRSYCLSGAKWMVCPGRYWPDITACGIWAEKQTQVESAGNAIVVGCASFITPLRLAHR
jgi:hypothetical protein